MKEVGMQLEGLRKYTKHSCGDDSQHEEEATTSQGAGQFFFSVDPHSTTTTQGAGQSSDFYRSNFFQLDN